MDRYTHGLEVDLFETLLGPAAAEPASPRVAEVDPWLASLRAVLAASPTPLPEHIAASSLGVSTRTMQRHLRSLGTTFRKERKALRNAALSR